MICDNYRWFQALLHQVFRTALPPEEHENEGQDQSFCSCAGRKKEGRTHRSVAATDHFKGAKTQLVT
jgi:hypothetical protein